MSQDRLSYEERNRQREERVLEHERALNKSRRKARHAHPQAEDPEALLKAEQSFKRRRLVAIIFAIIALIGLIVGLSKKPSTAHAVTQPSAAETGN